MLSAYSYITSPDGEDIIEKLMVVGKPATFLALSLASIDVMTSKIPRTYIEIFGRYAYITFPIVGIAAAFVVTSNISGQLRHKNDKYNWIAGGLASGMVFGKWRRSVQAGCLTGAAFAFAGAIAKHCWDQGIKFYPMTHTDPYSHYGGIRQFTDYSFTNDRPHNWKRSANE